MTTLRIGRFEIFIRTHKVPVKGLFRHETTGRGEIFLDLHRLEVRLTNHRQVDAYFERKRHELVNRNSDQGGPSSSASFA